MTQFYRQITPYLPLSRKRSPDSATSNWCGRYLIAAYYSFFDPERMKGWVGLVGRSIADGLPMWSPVSCRSRVGQGKFAGQRPTFYHCAMQPTGTCKLYQASHWHDKRFTLWHALWRANEGSISDSVRGDEWRCGSGEVVHAMSWRKFWNV